MTVLPWSFKKRMVSAIIARFSSGLTRNTSMTCNSHVLPTMVTTGVLAPRESAASARPFRRRRLCGGSCRTPRFGRSSTCAGSPARKIPCPWVGAGPAAFDVMDPERVELLGDAELVRHREIDAFTLRTVAQGRVIDFDLGFHKMPVKKRRTISLKFAGLANPKTGNQQAVFFDCRVVQSRC